MSERSALSPRWTAQCEFNANHPCLALATNHPAICLCRIRFAGKEYPLSRQDFEREQPFTVMRRLIDTVLGERHHHAPEPIDEVLFTGASTLIPRVRDHAMAHIERRNTSAAGRSMTTHSRDTRSPHVATNVPSEEASAIGAAIRASFTGSLSPNTPRYTGTALPPKLPLSATNVRDFVYKVWSVEEVGVGHPLQQTQNIVESTASQPSGRCGQYVLEGRQSAIKVGEWGRDRRRKSLCVRCRSMSAAGPSPTTLRKRLGAAYSFELTPTGC